MEKAQMRAQIEHSDKIELAERVAELTVIN